MYKLCIQFQGVELLFTVCYEELEYNLILNVQFRPALDCPLVDRVKVAALVNNSVIEAVSNVGTLVPKRYRRQIYNVN